ncbi:MAG: hypothetical protein ACTS7D_01925, partial [Candidatus Hodgkinia cicadicola]
LIIVPSAKSPSLTNVFYNRLSIAFATSLASTAEAVPRLICMRRINKRYSVLLTGSNFSNPTDPSISFTMSQIILNPISDGYLVSTLLVRVNRNSSSIDWIGSAQPKHHYTHLCVNASVLKALLNNGVLPSKPMLKPFESLPLRK